MKNTGQRGEVINYVVGNADSVVSGTPKQIGNLVGIPVTSSSTEGAVVAVNLEGAYKFVKATGFAPGQGARAYWDTAQSKVVGTASGTTFFLGFFFEAEVSGSVNCIVVLANEGNFGVAAAGIVALTDNSGGSAADGTIGAITAGTPADLAAQAAINTQIRDAVKELATKVNEVVNKLK